MTKFASQELDKVIVRLPDGMRDKLKEAAKAANRTMNAEIVSRLEFSFAADVVVQETGWDVGHGHQTPEFRAAYQRSKTLEQRVDELESKIAKLELLIPE